jgi:hypothetical protein
MDADEIEVIARALAEADDPGSWDLPEQFGQLEFRQHYRMLARVAVTTLQREKSKRGRQAVQLLRPDTESRPPSLDSDDEASGRQH